MLGGHDASLLPAYPCWTLCFWPSFNFLHALVCGALYLLSLSIYSRRFGYFIYCSSINHFWTLKHAMPATVPPNLLCNHVYYLPHPPVLPGQRHGGNNRPGSILRYLCIASTVADYAYISTWLVVAVEHPGSSMAYRRPNCVIVIVSTSTLASIWIKNDGPFLPKPVLFSRLVKRLRLKLGPAQSTIELRVCICSFLKCFRLYLSLLLQVFRWPIVLRIFEVVCSRWNWWQWFLCDWPEAVQMSFSTADAL